MSVVNQFPLPVARSHEFSICCSVESRRGLRRTLSESRLLRKAENQADIFLRLDGLSIQHGRVIAPLAHRGKRGREK